MNLDNFEISAELIHKLAALPDDPDAPIDFDALGIDAEAFQEQIKASLEAQINNSLQERAGSSLQAIEQAFHPLMLIFYTSLLIIAIWAIRTKSKWPGILLMTAAFFAIGLSENINTFLGDTIGQVEWIFENNPFDPMGMFCMLAIEQPLLIFMGLISLRFIYALLSRFFCQSCCRTTTKTVKKEDQKQKIKND